MNRVESVNLAGRTHHIERAGAEAIDAWLEAARQSLSGDPDREDLLLDFQRAIGEKCDASLTAGRDVVTTDEVTQILESLGTIEPYGDTDGSATVAGSAAVIEERPRRLYRLPAERMIAGVCSGMAVWLNVDVTVVRVAWVGLPVLLAGFTEGVSLPLAVALYALLAFILPRADSVEEKAAAHGYGVTARDRMLQARSQTAPALTSVGNGLGAAIRFVLRGTKVLLLVAITALLAMGIVGAGWVAVAGDPLLTVFGEDESSWIVPVLLTCAGVLVVAPLAALAAFVDYGIRATSGDGRQPGHLTAWLLSSTAAWVTAATVAFVTVATIPGVRDVWGDGEGRINFAGTTYCFVRDSYYEHCLPGDEVVQWDDEYELRSHVVPPRRVPSVPVLPTIPDRAATPALPATPAEPALPQLAE
jgi:phage shock protein PspC (stress-responsive transcriptional regulator)